MAEKAGEGSSTQVRESSTIPLQCPKLTESNYTQWAILMEAILKSYGFWDTIVSTESIDEKKMHTTKAMIFQTLPEDVLMQVAQYESAKEVWDSIKVRFLGANLVQKARLQTLRTEIEALKMKENESVNDFAGKLGSIKAKFKNLGTTLKDKVIVRKLLNSVPKKFLPIVAIIEQYSEVDDMHFEEAVGRIIAFEERLKSQDKPEMNDHDKLLMTSTSNHHDSKNYGRGHGDQNHSKGRKGSFNEGKGRGSFKQRDRDKSEFRCFECGEYGHFAKECTKWKDNEKDKQQQANLIYEDEEPMLL